MNLSCAFLSRLLSMIGRRREAKKSNNKEERERAERKVDNVDSKLFDLRVTFFFVSFFFASRFKIGVETPK